MRENRPKEWEILEEKALRLLSKPDLLLKNESAQLLLRLWQYPAFDRYKVWAIYARRNNTEKFLVQRVIWDRRADGERFHDPLAGLRKGFHAEPKITTKIKEVDSAVITPFLKELAGIRVSPFVVRDELGVDGETFGIEFKKFAGNARFSWWCHATTEWRELEGWFFKTKNFLDTQFTRIL
jgi:hypothetical protein